MNTNPDRGEENRLLDAVLRDENWRIMNDAMKAEALGAFAARQRIRRLARWTGGLAALAAIVGFGMRGLNRPEAAHPRTVAAKTTAASVGQLKIRSLTDEELVASFPPGTCFIAEIDGKKTLIFVDPKVEREYVANPRQESSWAR